VDRIVAYFREHAVDFASNLQPRWNNGYPDGIGAEVFSMPSLEWLDRHVDEARHREHVTTYFVEHPDRFKMGSCECPAAYRRPEIKLDVNTARDLEYLRHLLRDTADCEQPLQMPDIVRWYDRTGSHLRRD
jgi:spore coat polysaccharide biosynthesis protein SpsF